MIIKIVHPFLLLPMYFCMYMLVAGQTFKIISFVRMGMDSKRNQYVFMDVKMQPEKYVMLRFIQPSLFSAHRSITHDLFSITRRSWLKH